MLDFSKIAHCRAELRKLKLPKHDSSTDEYTEIWLKRLKYHSIIAKELRKQSALRELKERLKARRYARR